MSTSFLFEYFRVKQGSLPFKRKWKTILGHHQITSDLENIWIRKVAVIKVASSISSCSERMASTFWKVVVIDETNWFAALQRPKAELTITFSDFTWRSITYNLCRPSALCQDGPHSSASRLINRYDMQLEVWTRSDIGIVLSCNHSIKSKSQHVNDRYFHSQQQLVVWSKIFHYRGDEHKRQINWM